MKSKKTYKNKRYFSKLKSKRRNRQIKPKKSVKKRRMYSKKLRLQKGGAPPPRSHSVVGYDILLYDIKYLILSDDEPEGKSIDARYISYYSSLFKKKKNIDFVKK